MCSFFLESSFVFCLWSQLPPIGLLVIFCSYEQIGCALEGFGFETINTTRTERLSSTDSRPELNASVERQAGLERGDEKEKKWSKEGLSSHLISAPTSCRTPPKETLRAMPLLMRMLSSEAAISNQRCCRRGGSGL